MDLIKMTHGKNDVPELPAQCGVCNRYPATGALIPRGPLGIEEPLLNVCDNCGQLLRLYAVLSNGTGLRALPPPPPRWLFVRPVELVFVIACFAYAAYLLLR